MDKTTAQATLNYLQESIAAATEQVKELKAIIDAPDTPNVFQGTFVDFESARVVQRHTIYSDGEIDTTASHCQDRFDMGRMFPTEEAAQARVDYEKVRQLARIAMAKDWGNEPVTLDGDKERYCIVLEHGKPKIVSFLYTWYPIAFRTKLAARTFLSSISTEQLTLLLKGM
jgi:hypothetical protein